MHQTPKSCPLCSINRLPSSIKHYYVDIKRHYWQCLNCQLVFVDKAEHLSKKEEKAEYDLHENSLNDEGYLTFLNRLAEPLIKILPHKSHGLDFGCGPAPALAHLLQKKGHKVSLYDIYYYPEKEALNSNYGFICCTETVEHLSAPGQVIHQLWNQLLPGGLLAIMTKRVVDLDAFKTWHYKNDPTHISFFSLPTFHYIATELKAELTVIDKDIIFLKKAAI